MAKVRPSVQKRLKEARAIEKKQAKAARQAARAEAKASRPDVDDGVDPDLVGLTVGPRAEEPWYMREALQDE
ncbi:MAG: hypothetical protein H6732_01915 [Alphaproteobacteria bacterium]|nr:hypothetical protein [Alphaproteobacteria bacterium]